LLHLTGGFNIGAQAKAEKWTLSSETVARFASFAYCTGAKPPGASGHAVAALKLLPGKRMEWRQG
jgi:hypothetical protein